MCAKLEMTIKAGKRKLSLVLLLLIIMLLYYIDVNNVVTGLINDIVIISLSIYLLVILHVIFEFFHEILQGGESFLYYKFILLVTGQSNSRVLNSMVVIKFVRNENNPSVT